MKENVLSLVLLAAVFSVHPVVYGSDEPLIAVGNWKFANGGEYAKEHGTPQGSVKQRQGENSDIIALNYDFGLGGYYVGAEANVDIPEGTKYLKGKIYSESRIKTLGLRFVDSTGQLFVMALPYSKVGSRENFKFLIDGSEKIGSHVFGANDGVVHFPIKVVVFVLFKDKAVDFEGTVEFEELTLEK